MNIVVIGGGVVGMSTAWRLDRDGHSVTVLDRAETPGLGTSFANAGQLSYSYVAPLADSTIWAQLPKLLTDPDSPVQFRPGFDPFQYRWLLSFLAACTSKQASETIDRLGALANRSRELLHEVPELTSLAFNRTSTGKIVVYSSRKSFEHARAQAERQAASGTDKRALELDETLAVEPALASIRHRLVGGLFSPNDEAGDSHLFSRALAGLLETSANGSRFMGGVTVTGFRRAGKRIVAIETSTGPIEADLVVLAAGLEARALGRMVGISLPIYPLKGYSATAAIADDSAAPKVSVTDAARKIVYARIGSSLRLAGAADLVGPSLDIDRARLDTIMAHANTDFGKAADWARAQLWAGLRPATPTGRPIIGQMGPENLLVNVGHGALGFTLALGSADALAKSVSG